MRKWPALLIFAAACGGESGSGQLPPAIVFQGKQLPTARFGAEYAATLDAQGGTPPFRYSIIEGRLPDAITLSSAGEFSGRAVEPGTYAFTVKVVDELLVTANAIFTIRIEPEPLEIANRTLPSGREGDAYEVDLTAHGGIRPYTWSSSAGAFPPGITLSAEGKIAGTPTSGGYYTFTVAVTDSESKTAEQELSIMLAAANPMIITRSVDKARTDVLYEARLVAGGGDVPYTWDVAGGELPPGLVLANDGVIAGTPTTPGDYSPIIRVSDARSRTDMATIPIRVVAPLIITTPALNQIVRNRMYEFFVEAEGGEGPYSWSLEGAAMLPRGISFNATGRFFGTTTEVGDYPLTIRVRDSAGIMKSAMFTLSVSERFEYTLEPSGMDAVFPPACTSTTVSYKYFDVNVTDSFQIEDLDVQLDATFPPMSMSGLRIVLFGPDGAQAVLCGNEAGPWGGCLPSDLSRSFDDDGPMAIRPQRPLYVFDAINAHGLWRLLIATVQPTCGVTGSLRSVKLSFTDDRATEPYLHVSGWEKNNLVIEPFIHLTHPQYPDLGVGPHELFLHAAIYDVGPNGYREAGQGDDVLDPTPVTWSWDVQAVAGADITPDGYVWVDSSAAVCAGGCPGTGQARIIAAGGGLMFTTTLRILPPDFDTRKRRY